MERLETGQAELRSLFMSVLAGLFSQNTMRVAHTNLLIHNRPKSPHICRVAVRRPNWVKTLLSSPYI
ncbi:hypothetical protein GDO81_009085 [Engystomops pustulosus]|uniref:Uncharacterized protein n=1 Tax=Engystomops pustulosus TaxID=76066 RepID=A0AAV7BNW0_ENGPU|nr:hypothetical protein GDO81_009085 [Engystomops pustulosus]